MFAHEMTLPLIWEYFSKGNSVIDGHSNNTHGFVTLKYEGTKKR